MRVARLPLMILLAELMAAGGCADRPGQRWDWERMRSQPRYEPYGASRLFADGSAMRKPPTGTASRESAAEGGAAAAGVPPTASPERGATRFQIFCAVCHGELADGKSIVASNMDAPKPPSLRSPAVRSFTPQQLYTIITGGFGRMPSYAAELSVADRWAVVAYVRALDSRGPAAPADSASVPHP